MGELQVTLSAEERDALVELLEAALKDLRIEEHRTRAPSFREYVLRREQNLNSALAKLRGSPA